MPAVLESTPPPKGLEGVVANQSSICYVFGEEGRLIRPRAEYVGAMNRTWTPPPLPPGRRG